MRIKQFRFYKDGSNKNYPGGLTKDDLVSGNAFVDCGSIYQLGIQTSPGTKFYLNDSGPIIIGITGIYELELHQTTIESLRFDKESIAFINEGDSSYLIVDILCESEE